MYGDLDYVVATDGVVRQLGEFLRGSPEVPAGCGLSSFVAEGLGLAAVAVPRPARATQVLCWLMLQDPGVAGRGFGRGWHGAASLFSHEVVVILLRWCWPSQLHTT